MKVAVIPARGGSKRIPRKNIKLFHGKPMIAWSILTAIESGLFDKVIVSTDDNEIAGIAKQYGAEIPFLRPVELSNDFAGTIPVVAHATQWLLENDFSLDAVCCIYATAPFVQIEDLTRGLELLNSGNWNYSFAVTDYAASIFRAFQQTVDGGVKMFFPEHFSTRSQDLPNAFHDAGQFYWGKPMAWLEQSKIFDLNSSPVFIPRWRVQDIDTLEDWKRAELVFAMLQQTSR